MKELNEYILSTIAEFETDKNYKIDLSHDLRMAQLHPQGQEQYFKELLYDLYKKIDENLIGNLWFHNDSINPFKILPETGELWIEFVVRKWLSTYEHKKDPDLIEGLNRSARVEINLFLKTYYYIQLINNHLNSLNNTSATVTRDFSDFFIPEFKYTERLIERLKKILHGKKGQSIRFVIEALKSKGLLEVKARENKELYEAIKVSFGWDIGTYNSIFDIKALNGIKDSKTFQEYITAKNSQHKAPYQKIEKVVDSILLEFLS